MVTPVYKIIKAYEKISPKGSEIPMEREEGRELRRNDGCRWIEEHFLVYLTPLVNLDIPGTCFQKGLFPQNFKI
jgi:hypothetical protein